MIEIIIIIIIIVNLFVVGNVRWGDADLHYKQ
jgi:hypothetical protein